jgi:drug/metabolite transporter (DMT)-like permease
MGQNVGMVPISALRMHGCHCCSLSVLPLSAAASINFSTPLFTALLSTIILQEPWNPRVIAGTPSSLVCIFPSLTISVLQCRGLTPNRTPVSLFVDSFERG